MHALTNDGTAIEASIDSSTSLHPNPTTPHTITLRVTEPAHDVSLWALAAGTESRVQVAYELAYAAVVPPPLVSGAGLGRGLGRWGWVGARGRGGGRGGGLGGWGGGGDAGGGGGLVVRLVVGVGVGVVGGLVWLGGWWWCDG